MKLQAGKYYCEWCSLEFERNIERVEGNGRKGVGVDQCICPKCNKNRNRSQIKQGAENMNPNYNEQFKIRLASSDKSMSKHDIIKIELVRAIKRVYKKKINHQIIYTEHQIREGVVCDVYHYNNLTKSAVAYEIQKDTSIKWMREILTKYEKAELDLQIIHLRSISDNIPELIEQVEALVC